MNTSQFLPADGVIVAVIGQIGPSLVYFVSVSLRALVIVVGYNIVKRGQALLVSGISGEFTFGGRIKRDIEFKLVSTSPGLLFLLLGAALIGWAIFGGDSVSFPDFSMKSQAPSASRMNGSTDSGEFQPTFEKAH